jgi:hypothetical protein
MERPLNSIQPSSHDKPADQPAGVDPGELIDEAETAKLLRQKPQTMAAWRCDNRGPEYVKVGRRVFYRRSSISAFLAACIVSPGAK